MRFALTYVDTFTPSPSLATDIPTLPGVRTRDLAVLSALNKTIIACNANMASYTFGLVASSLHSFFLYDLCDVYLELIKPVISPPSEEGLSAAQIESNQQQKFAAQATLYTCLETFLRLLHPLMPFVTEELWQRLPNREALTTVPSIMIARYPQEVPSWDNAAAEEGMEIIKGCVHTARSMRVDYKIGNHVKANFYYRTESAETMAQVRAQEEDFCTLAKGGMFQYLDAATPNPNKNMSIKVVSDSLSVLVDLTGLIDIEAEIVRLKKDKIRIETYIDQYNHKMNAEGYPGKVPEAVQLNNKEKLAAYETELATTLNAIEGFEKMSL